jgi:hypothetical protein
LKVVVFADKVEDGAHPLNGCLQRVFGVQHGSGKVKEFGITELAEGALSWLAGSWWRCAVLWGFLWRLKGLGGFK